MTRNSNDYPTHFVGPWLVSIDVGGAPSPLRQQSINPLSADALATISADGTISVSVSPVYPVPNHAISAERLLVGTGFGSWTASGERTAAVRCAALVRGNSGNPVATLFLDATVELDVEADTLSWSYTVESHLSRGWTSSLPSLDGSVQGWRVERP